MPLSPSSSPGRRVPRHHLDNSHESNGTTKIELTPQYEDVNVENSYFVEPTYSSPDELYSFPDAAVAGIGVGDEAPPPPLPPTCSQRSSLSREVSHAPEQLYPLHTKTMNGSSQLPAQEGQGHQPRERGVGLILSKAFSSVIECLNHNRRIIQWILLIVFHGLIIGYTTMAILHWKKQVEAGHLSGLDWCDGLGLFIIIFTFGYILVVYYQALKPLFKHQFKTSAKPALENIRNLFQNRIVKWVLIVAILVVLLLFLILDAAEERLRLVSFLGIVVFVIFGFLFSRYPGYIRWRTVLNGLLLQFILGYLTLRWENGRTALQCIGEKMAALLSCADAGSTFVFGEELVTQHPVFAFHVLPVIFFFSAIIQMLYHVGAMQWTVTRLGWILQVVMGTTVCESVNAAGGVFLGMTESPLLIRPYIKDLTRSELHSVFSTGLATVSGSVMAAYISFGAEPGHLVTASIMSSAGALAYSKLFYPEIEQSKTTVDNIVILKSEDSNIIDAAAKGASAGISIVLNVAANLVAFVSLIFFLNNVIGWLGELVGFDGLTFELILSKVFIPVSWLMGVEWADCENVGILVGLKTVVNEFVAFKKMGEMKKANLLSPRSLAIATFAICGFSNPGSLAVMMSIISAMEPSQRSNVSEIAFRGLVTGIITCCLTACMAGLLMPGSLYAAKSTF